MPFARHSQPTGIPRPHQWLLMGIQRRQYTYPKARSIASSGRSSVPFARHSQPTGIPRPHQWLQTPKNHPIHLKPFLWASSAGSQQASQGHINGFLWASKLAVCPKTLQTLQTLKTLQTSKPSKPLKPSQGHINGNRYPKATSMVSHGHPLQAI